MNSIKKPGIQHPGVLNESVTFLPILFLRQGLPHLGGGLGTRTKPSCTLPSTSLSSIPLTRELNSLTGIGSLSGTRPTMGVVAINPSAKLTVITGWSGTTRSSSDCFEQAGGNSKSTVRRVPVKRSPVLIIFGLGYLRHHWRKYHYTQPRF